MKIINERSDKQEKIIEVVKKWIEETGFDENKIEIIIAGSYFHPTIRINETDVLKFQGDANTPTCVYGCTIEDGSRSYVVYNIMPVCSEKDKAQLYNRIMNDKKFLYIVKMLSALPFATDIKTLSKSDNETLDTLYEKLKEIELMCKK